MSDVAYIVLSTLGALLIEVLLFYLFCRDLDTKRPAYNIAWLSGVFSIGSIIAFILLNQGHAQASGTRSWFSLGWKGTHIFLFNIPIASWQSYALLIIYQITRTMIGALTSNIFRVYVSVNILGSKAPTHEDKMLVMIAFGMTTFFNFWVSVTDIFIVLTSWIFTVVALVSQVLADCLCLHFKLQRTIEEDTPPHAGRVFQKTLDALE